MLEQSHIMLDLQTAQGYDKIASDSGFGGRSGPYFANLQQNPHHFNFVTRAIPALLWESRLWAAAVQRECVAMEFMEIQGYTIFDQTSPFRCEFIEKLESLPESVLRSMAGNTMRRAAVGG